MAKFCIKFGYLILRKIFKFVANSCQISRLECTKFNFGWGPPGGELTVLSQTPYLDLRGLLQGKEWRMGGESRGVGREGKGRRGEGVKGKRGDP